MTLPINLVFFRHGQSEGNLAKRRSEAGEHGAYDTVFAGRHTRSFRLTQLGREQAERAGAWLRDEFHFFDQYMVSEYARALETAGLLGMPNAQWRIVDLLTERDWGDLDRCSEQERATKFEDSLRMRRIDPFFWRPPNGESLHQLRLRLDRVLGTLHRECSDKNVLIVCHGEVMWTYRVILERMPQHEFRKLHLSNDPEDRLHNCEVLHYTRRDPDSGALSPHVGWMRRIRPAESPLWISPWKRIERRLLSNEELLETVGLYAPVLE